MSAVRKRLLCSISEGEEAHKKKLSSFARVSGYDQLLSNFHEESCCKPNGVYFANDFGPSKANGNNILSISNVSVENQLAEPLKSSTLDKKKNRENFKTKATSPKALMIVHDNKSDKHTAHKIKDIFQAKRQVDIWKDNSGKFESTDFVLAEPKIKWGDPYDGSDKSKDEIKNLIHNQHSRLKPSVSPGSRRGHKKAGKLRFSKHRQRPKIFESGGNNYSISSEELNRYFETRCWPRIYNSLDKITADFALNNRKRTALNDINTKSKYENEPKHIFEGSEIFQKDSNGARSFSVIKEKQQNNGKYDELIKYRVRKPTKIIRNSNIKPNEDLRGSEMEVSKKKTKSGEGLIASNGFQASGIFLKNLNRGILQGISRRERNTFDFNRFYEEYLFPQTGKNFPKKFQNRQSPKFLPKLQQFGRNIADLHHELNAFIESSKQKRSFTHYNDLAERNPLYKNDYDYDFIDYSKYISDSKSRNIDEDEQPCSSCGGKSKKPPTKTDSNIMTRNNKCNCKGYQQECLCSSRKAPRSLYDTCLQHECALAVPNNEIEDIPQKEKYLVPNCSINNAEQLIRNICQRESLDFVLIPCGHNSVGKIFSHTKTAITHTAG
uniref:Uncharacterized protein n=1 Tax=Bactrocera dorsalis TaxID=27457 RepID=A0A034WSF1_BACDO